MFTAESKALDINEGVRRFRETAGAILLDVRTRGEYEERAIPQSINHPLDELASLPSVVEKADTPLFVYCRSGARSARAAAYLRGIGYSNVTDIGGILYYKG